MPLSSSSSLNATSVVPASEVPSGASTWTVHSPMSSLGTNSRPTMRLSGNVSANVTSETAMIANGWSSAQFTRRSYQLSSQWKKPRSLVLASASASASFRNRELSIGVSVKLTSIDTMIANAMVQPNGLMNRFA